VGATNCCFLLEPGGRPRGRFSVPGVCGEAVGRVPGVWITSCVVPGAIYLRGLPLFRLAGSVLSMPPGVTSMLVPMPGNISAMEWGPDSATYAVSKCAVTIPAQTLEEPLCLLA
jgi:hypothetical protein